MLFASLLILSLDLLSTNALDSNGRKRLRSSAFGIAGQNASYDYVGKSLAHLPAASNGQTSYRSWGLKLLEEGRLALPLPRDLPRTHQSQWQS
jgi:hypothetical protein